MTNFQPRYIYYSKSQGNTPENQLIIDEKKYPGGKMCGFILYINEKLHSFYKEHKEYFIDRHTLVDQKAFTEYLKNI